MRKKEGDHRIPGDYSNTIYPKEQLTPTGCSQIAGAAPHGLNFALPIIMHDH
jgi:hypothetical protein